MNHTCQNPYKPTSCLYKIRVQQRLFGSTRTTRPGRPQPGRCLHTEPGIRHGVNRHESELQRIYLIFSFLFLLGQPNEPLGVDSFSPPSPLGLYGWDYFTLKILFSAAHLNLRIIFFIHPTLQDYMGRDYYLKPSYRRYSLETPPHLQTMEYSRGVPLQYLFDSLRGVE